MSASEGAFGANSLFTHFHSTPRQLAIALQSFANTVYTDTLSFAAAVHPRMQSTANVRLNYLTCCTAARASPR